MAKDILLLLLVLGNYVILLTGWLGNRVVNVLDSYDTIRYEMLF